MQEKYRNIFKELIHSYYKGNFEEKVTDLLSTPNINKKDLSNIISSICGVEVNYNGNYINNLKKAISSYEINHKVVNKIKHCTMDCVDDKGKTLCEKSCPFDAIFINENNTTAINLDKCTDCGFCVEACPSGALIDKKEFIPLINLLKSSTPIIAAVAPAICGQFGENVSINQMRSAFKKIGFSDMVEVSFFADMLTLKEVMEFDKFVKNKNDLMITSCCCPMWVGMLKQIYNNLIKYVSPSVSPMIAAGRVIKKLNPNCKVVFIGPCIAKKGEAKQKDVAGAIDFVLTFTELKDIFNTLNIKPEELEEDISLEYSSRGGRLYARTGGVSIAISDAIKKIFPEKHTLFKAIQGNGVKECKELLSKAEKGELEGNFIEGMGCIGGCVGGPKALIPKEKGTKRVNLFAESSEIKVSVDSNCMNEILQKIGINSLKDFQNKDKTSIFERHF